MNANSFINSRGSDGSNPMSRLTKLGLGKKPSNAFQETIVCYIGTAQEVVQKIIVDDDNKNRDNRNTLFDPDITLVGVDCQNHPTAGQCCVIDFIDAWVVKK